jgi:hypothetical protein
VPGYCKRAPRRVHGIPYHGSRLSRRNFTTPGPKINRSGLKIDLDGRHSNTPRPEIFAQRPGSRAPVPFLNRAGLELRTHRLRAASARREIVPHRPILFPHGAEFPRTGRQ